MNHDASKRAAATAALPYIKHGMALGVGTGSTVDILIELLQPLASTLGPVVSSSERSTRRLAEFGIRTVDLGSTGDLDLYIDGADEATKHRHLIKGGGGALTREKIVAAVARKFVCIADASKLVGVLGKFPLPVEVIPMARSYVARQLVLLGGQPAWRMGFTTDNGNVILDVHNLSIANPAEMEAKIRSIVGVVTVGLFAQRGADVILLGTDAGVKTIRI